MDIGKNNILHIWKKVHEKNLIKKKTDINNFVVITSYFNPQRSKNRYQNFLKFSQHMADLKIPLYVIEGHHYKDRPQLTKKDCQNLHTFKYYDILWQKERLLNILVDKLPPEVDCFGWFDADIIFSCDNLKEKCEETLRYYPVMQPWSTCHFLDKDGNTLQDFYSMSSKNFLREDKIVEQKREHPGFAWCIRRDEFVKMGNFYDIMICGNGDTFMAMAFFNHLNYPFMQQEKINLPTSQHFIRWWKQCSKVINSQVGFLDIEINHLYHGTRQNRRYWERVKNLFDNGFNPDIHLEYARNKTYKFSDNTPAVIKNYLEDLLLNQRRDDE